MDSLINLYNKAFKELVEEFTYRWLKDIDPDEDYNVSDYYYIIGGLDSHIPPDIVAINEEYYFSINDIWTVIKHNIPMYILCKWYSYSEERAMQSLPIEINLYNFFRRETVDPKVLEEERRIDIEHAEQRLKDATIAFYKEMGMSEEDALKSIEHLIKK